MERQGRVLVIACGALAREITALKRASRWDALEVTCLPPELHMRPERIPAAVQAAIEAARADYARIFVAYADCGTGGALDRVLAAEGIERLPGAHCYEFYATSAAFAALAEDEVGTFYLTDFLTRHFERLVWAGLGLDRYPQLQPDYFGHYRRIVYLAQVDDEKLTQQAEAIATRLGLAFERRLTGYGDLATRLAAVAGPAAPSTDAHTPPGGAWVS
ncbi:MAG: DUF1638 domain-containing protein [Proteobacteria bacterium]|nr:DUF1638 domain-containing protein [Pseudomonadota bacterium]